MDKLTKEQELALSKLKVIENVDKSSFYNYDITLLNALIIKANELKEGDWIRYEEVPNVYTIKAKLKQKLDSDLFKVVVTNYNNNKRLIITKLKTR